MPVESKLDGVALCQRLESLSIRNVADLTDMDLIAIARGCSKMSKFEVQGCKKITGRGIRTFVCILSRTLVEVKISCCVNLARLLQECHMLRKLFIHGMAHEHFLMFLLRIPNLRDVYLREDYYPAPENDMSTEMRADSCSRFEDALNRLTIPHNLCNLVVTELDSTEKLVNEIGELRAISSHVLGASGVQIPQDGLDNLRSTEEEEDGATEVLDPRDVPSFVLLEITDFAIYVYY
uniref:F-box protein MAX2 n=1 Tax=Tanacetum cinerariifolium TaxID=118510 RepID=A0A6L2P0Y6_TANCI|nr:F-box protein MAX2 [Tanacetum cinerariifolium]